jgi:hypothetical protein
LNGQLDNTIPFILGPGASVIYGGGSLLGIESSHSAIPDKFFMDQNFPNPFNPSTTIRFGLPAVADVRITIFNLLGQEVAVPVEGRLQAGEHTLLVNAANLSSGVYLYRVQAGDKVSIKRMVLMK